MSEDRVKEKSLCFSKKCAHVWFPDMKMDNTLQHTLRPFLVFAQIFGTMPLTGLFYKKNQHLINVVKFRWLSTSVAVTIIFLVISLSEWVLSFDAVITIGLNLNTTGSLTFSTVCCIACILFSILSYFWSEIMQDTFQCERIFLKKIYASKESEHFCRNIRFLGFLLLFGAFVEHIMFKAQAIYTSYKVTIDANATQDGVDSYYSREGPRLLRSLRSYKWLIPIIEWPQFAGTFIWNFVDIFIALMAKSLAIRFRQMYWCIQMHTHKNMPEEFWRQRREDFLTLVELLNVYDSKLSPLMLLSCTHNLYFICIEIFYTFQPKPHIVFEIYFYMSLSFVLLRFFTMMFNAAAVQDTVKQLTSLLYEIPTSHWCLELKRLNEMLVTDAIALSGHKFFFLTRGLIMALVGTIIIYELVLIDKIED